MRPLETDASRRRRTESVTALIHRAVFVKYPQGVRVLGFDIRTRDLSTFGYEHLVEGRSQCWSLHPAGSTGGVKIDPLNLFMGQRF